ncbi:MAG: hypothetical protein D4R79_06450 [Comamonadaceae bacterium]|nr:MAG: hypothetical protein D4R79_06450 [Comamonadaceae bacterium]
MDAAGVPLACHCVLLACHCVLLAVIASPDQSLPRARSGVRGFSTRNPVLAYHWIPDRVRDDKVSLSLRATTRNPVLAWHWIPDQVRDDKLDVRDDKLDVRDDKLDVWDDKLDVWDDNFLSGMTNPRPAWLTL